VEINPPRVGWPLLARFRLDFGDCLVLPWETLPVYNLPRRQQLPMKKQAGAQPHLDSSREKLVCSAERLFAERGFDGVSVRDIANDAGVNSALVGYYFRGKEGLLSEVYMRHCEPLKRERERLLERFAKTDGKLTLERVIEAFIRPSLEVTTDKNGRTEFTRLRAILSAENSALLEQLVAENFDRSSRMFVDAMRKCLPELSRDEIFWRFHFLLGTVYYTGAGPHRIRTLSRGRCDPSDPVATTKHLIPFLAAGFRAPGVKKKRSSILLAPREGKTAH
jgi:AcrR family transcriptional regulator